MGNLYRGTLNEKDIIDTATVTLVPGQYVDLGIVKVAADELIGMGYGASTEQNTAQGRIFVDLQDASANAIEGMFRIYMTSSQQLPVGERPVIIDVDLSALRQGASDRSIQIPFPFNNVMLSKDKEFHFQCMNTASSAQTVALAKSTALVDITRQLV